MDFQQYRQAISRSQSARWTSRQKRLDALARVLAGKQYEHLKYSFSQEREGEQSTGRRILLDERRPSSQAKLPKELVRDQVGLIFGEDHRPLVIAKQDERDEDTTEWIAAFIHDTKFWLTLMDALWKGSIGSSLIVLRVLGKTKEVEDEPEEEGQEPQKRTEPDGPGRYYFEVWPGQECSPIFKRSAPDVLEKVDRRYFIGEDALAAQDYDVEELKKKWDKEQGKGWRKKSLSVLAVNEWAVRIVLTETEEQWYQPVPRYIYERPDWTDSKWAKDDERSFEHEIGEVPGQWVRPLPINADEHFPDGDCLFIDVIDPEYRINRTTSQVGRGFDYSGDPQIARSKGRDGKVGASSFGTPVAMGGTASDVIELEAGGDAKFVEITGEGLKVAIESYVGGIRDIGKGAGAMSRVTPDSKTGMAHDLSSVAMKMLNFAQLTLSGILRETAAEIPGGNILRLAMRLWSQLDVDLPSLKQRKDPDETAKLEWQWPDYYEPHGQEKLFEVQAINEAQLAGNLSKESAVANTAPMFDVSSTEDELDKIKNDQKEQLTQDVAREDEMGKVRQKYEPATGSTNGATPSK